MSKKYRILSIDGGGVRGIIPARILQEIEEKTGKPIYQLFDMIVGTSAGALIALASTCQYSYSAEWIVEIYKNQSKYIFHKSIMNTIKSCFNLFGPKYDRTFCDSILESIFDIKIFKDTKCKVVIPVYDLIRDRPIIFRSWDCGGVLMKEVAAGATAAPTYFSPVSVHNIVDYCLIDGGIWANNPELIGVYEALALNPELKKEDIYVLSIGTGKVGFSTTSSKLQNAGIIGWLKGGLINMMMEAESEWTTKAAKELCPNMIRIEPDLLGDTYELDNVSDRNIAALLSTAERYISNNQDVMKSIVGILLEKSENL